MMYTLMLTFRRVVLCFSTLVPLVIILGIVIIGVIRIGHGLVIYRGKHVAARQVRVIAWLSVPVFLAHAMQKESCIVGLTA